MSETDLGELTNFFRTLQRWRNEQLAKEVETGTPELAAGALH